MIKRLSSFMVVNVGGGDRISYTYDEIDEETGNPISQNNKKSFYVVDSDLEASVNEVRTYIREHKLSD